MKRKIIFLILIVALIGLTVFFIFNTSKNKNILKPSSENNKTTYNDFKINEVYHSPNNGDIHYSIYIPDDYNKEKTYPLYITLPGYEGLYFQGVGVNLQLEDFAKEAKKINNQMIILAPQLNDWKKTSADQTIALIE